MNAVTNIIDFPVATSSDTGQGVRVADCDDGYTRIANELLEAALCTELTVRQLKIVLAVIRKTYGFNKKTDRITNTQIEKMTGIHHTHICKAKNELLDRHILVMVGREMGVNKVVSEWKNAVSQNSKTLANSANKTLANSANDRVPSQLNTKDTLKDKKDKELLKEKTISAEPSREVSPPAADNQKTDNSKSVITLILKTGEEWPVTKDFFEQMRELYPNSDTLQEFRNMAGWLIGNPAKRKTKAGIKRFVTGWLVRNQKQPTQQSGNSKTNIPRQTGFTAGDIPSCEIGRI